MRLYYHPLSSNSRRVLLTALELCIPLDLVALDLTGGAHKAPDYLRLNPAGRVPLLVDDDFHLWESHAIMQYLADKTSGQTLYPLDVKARADVNRWLFWSAFHFAPTAACLIRERVSKRVLGGVPDPAEIARGDALLPPAMRLLDEQLAGRQWIAQDRLTLADLAVADARGGGANSGGGFSECQRVVRADAGTGCVVCDSTLKNVCSKTKTAPLRNLSPQAGRGRLTRSGRRVRG